MTRLTSFVALLRKTYVLAKPYGRKKLMVVFLWVLAQGTMQVVGVTSIFPFLAVAAEPDRMRNSALGIWLLQKIPPMDDRSLLILCGTMAITALFLSNALNVASEFTRVRYAYSFGHWLRLRLLRHFVNSPYSFFLQNNSSTLLKKVATDVTQYIQGVLLPVLDCTARLLTTVLLLLIVFVADPTLALFAGMGFGGYYACVLWYLNQKLVIVSEELKAANRGALREANQLLAGIKPLKVQAAQEHFIERFAKHSYAQSHFLSRIPVYSTGPRYLIEPLAFGGLVGIVLIMAVNGRSLTEVLPVVGVIALAGYRLIPTLQLLYGQIANLTAYTHSLDEIYTDLTAEACGQRSSRQSGEARAVALKWRSSIRLDRVTFAYPGTQKRVIEEVSLTIPKNASVAFVGKTGCGKSTLLDLILGLQEPTSGKILIDGVPLGPENLPAWLAGIGYVPQDIFLIDDTITANVALGIPATEVNQEDLRSACGMAQVLSFIEKDLPDGFNTIVGERGVRLSGGQRQRIGLARALYRKPNTLILDEATSALDQSTEADLVAALKPLQGSLTMLIVTHRTTTISGCDQIYALDSNYATRDAGLASHPL